jgi:hypothetical protein
MTQGRRVIRSKPRMIHGPRGECYLTEPVDYTQGSCGLPDRHSSITPAPDRNSSVACTPGLTPPNVYVSKTNMEHTAPTTSEPAPPDPAQDRSGCTIPERLAAPLHVVRVLLGHGRRLAETVPDRAASVEFATLAAVCGTYNLPSILARLQRGILRAMALERYLLARAEKGRDIIVVEPRERMPVKRPVESPVEPPEGGAQQARTPKRRPFDPDNLHIPTLKKLDAEVRRRPLGRTIATICMDLAVVPGFCSGAFWNQVFDTLQAYGGNLTVLYKVREHCATSFQKERDQHPESWDWDWKDLARQTVRQVLGCLIGEAPILDPFGPPLATAPP